MNRREFEKLMAMATAATALSGRLSLAEEGPRTNVVLTGVAPRSPETTLIEAVKKATEAVTDFTWLSRGDSVIIKPALNSGNPYPATTHPTGIKAMVELLKAKGAGRVIVMDMAGIEHVKLEPKGVTRGSTRKLMKSSGIADAAQSAGAELYFPEEDGWEAFFEDTPRNGRSWKQGITMPKKIKEVDHVVLMPRCSRHPLSGSSLGMKAAVGWWRTDTRLEYHHDAATFQEKTAEANTVNSLLEKQRLVLTVADQVQTTFGPDKGYCLAPATGLVIASISVVAHDMVSLAWLLENRKLTPDREKSVINDPYENQAAVSNANRGVVMALGGMRSVVGIETLTRNNINAIFDDRIIRRGCEVLGGTPSIQFVLPDDSVPASLVNKLKGVTTQ